MTARQQDETPKNRTDRSREGRRRRLIEALRGVAQRLGPDISIARFYRETGITDRQVYLLFDGWAELRTEAGLPAEVDRSRLLRRYSREQLLALLADAAAELGEEISHAEFISRTGVSSNPVKRLFGCWQDFKRAGGLTTVRRPGPRLRFTREELLERLRALVEEQGDITLDIFCEELNISTGTLRRFGTWRELRLALDLPARCRPRRVPRDPDDWQSQLVAQIPPPPPGLPPDPLANLTLTQLLHIAKARAR